MLICFYGDHTHAHTHTQFCLARSGACPGANGTEPDQTGSDWERHVLYSSFWLCAFATLAYWILGFLLFGAFLLVLFYFFCWTSCLSFGSENWTRTWTGPDRLLWGGRLVKERKAGTGDKHITSLSVHTTTGASSTTMKASTLIQFFSVFTPSTKQLDAKISHLSHRCHWGELDSSIYMHLIHFIDPSVTYSWIYISSVYRRFVVLLWICQCQILSLGTEVFRPWLFECVLFYCLRSERVELTYIIMCQLFFLSVSPPYRTIFRWLDLCSLSGGIQLTTSVFHFFFLYIYSTKDVFILCIWRVLFQIETDWNTDTFLHRWLLAWK